MPVEAPNGEPLALVIGTNWEWDKTFSAAPPSEGFALTYTFTGPAAVPAITAATSADGDFYEVRELASFSAGLTPGSYVMVGQVDDGTDTHEIYRQIVTLELDVPASVSNQQTFDERLRDQLQNAILQLTTNPFAVVVVNGRRVEYTDPGELQRQLGIVYSRIRLSRAAGQLQRRKIAFRPVSAEVGSSSTRSIRNE